LFRKASILSKLKNYEAAAKAYQQIIEFHPLDVLADDALFAIATLYENKLNQPENAKIHYEKIIFDHPDSIYFVDAQKAFRKLRGDSIN
jgi:tetratricopeptide (TPR) repeat protein